MATLSTGNLGSSQYGQALSQGMEPFPDPFCDYASLAMPRTWADALRWMEYIALANGVYRSALDRIIAYFITEVEIGSKNEEESIGREEKNLYKDFLYEIGIEAELRQIALDYLVYGNSFLSTIVPFRRYLACRQPGCGFEAPFRQIYSNPRYAFEWSNYNFHATCPHCNYTGPWDHIDRKERDSAAITLKRWNVHEMELMWDPYSDQVEHIWRVPQYYRQHISSGRHPFHLEGAPWEVIQAVKNNNFIQFEQDVIHHAKEDTLCGVHNKGWGISRVLTNFRQAWYVQVLHRYNEAIGLDYIIPFRVITPESRPGGTTGGGEMTDPLFSVDMGGFSGQVQNMLRKRRRDPTTWHTLPMPIRYQALGGEASQLAPHELMDQGMDTLLNAIGTPVEFYKANLSLQAAPAALRLMESTWSHLTHMLNRSLQWFADKVSVVMDWQEVSVKLAKPSHADDLNRQLAKLQLMLSRDISRTTGLKSVGLDFENEERRKLEEEKFTAEETDKLREELELGGLGDMLATGQLPGEQPPPGDPAAGGQPAAGGAPAGDPAAAPADPAAQILASLPVGPNESVTPQEMVGQAGTIAQQLFSMPESQKDSTLRKIKQTAPHIHDLVKSQLAALRNQARNQGLAFAQQSAGGQPAGAA